MKVELNLKDKNYIEQVIYLRYLMQHEEKGIDIFKLENNKEEIMLKISNYVYKHLGNDLHIFTYIKDDIVISMCSLLVFEYMPDWHNNNALKGVISGVYTREEHRGLGYQKTVMKTALDKANELNINQLMVNTNNEIAAKLYESVGFKKSENSYKLRF